MAEQDTADKQRAALADAAEAAQDNPESERRFIYVKAAPTMGNRMALWDRHPAHPGGEVKVYGQEQEPVKVAADAPEVATALDQKRIVVLEGRSLERARRAASDAQERQVRTRDAELALRRQASQGSLQELRDQMATLQKAVAAGGGGGESGTSQEVAELRAQVAELRAQQSQRKGGSGNTATESAAATAAQAEAK